MKKLLITGASGFVGNHFIEQFSDKYEITALVHKDSVQKKEAVREVKIDLTKVEQVRELFFDYEPEYILHLAGKAKTWGVYINELIKLNFEVSKNILDVIDDDEYHLNYKPKIVMITSAEVYGKTTNPESITEENSCNPISAYGLSKLMVDRLGYLYAQNYDLPIVLLRSFNHAGPGQKLGFFISDIASQIAKIENGKQSELLVGNLSSIRDILDVRDVVKAYDLALTTDLPNGEAYNICSAKGVSMQELLDKLVSCCEKKIPVKKDRALLRKSDNPMIVGNYNKFHQATNWIPTIALDKTLEDCLNYWRNVVKFGKESPK